jgi:aspartate/glutamate racemase
MQGSVASDFTRMPRCLIPIFYKTVHADKSYCTLTADEHKRITVARLIITEMIKGNILAIDMWNTHINVRSKRG